MVEIRQPATMIRNGVRQLVDEELVMMRIFVSW